MYTVGSLLLIGRCALLLSLLVLSRLIAPRLIDNALSESDYTLESEDAPALPQPPAALAALPTRPDLAGVAQMPRQLESRY